MNMDADFAALKEAEERKRERNWNPAARWRAIQNMITWAEQQSTCRRNTPEACIRKERRLRRTLEGRHRRQVHP